MQIELTNGSHEPDLPFVIVKPSRGFDPRLDPATTKMPSSPMLLAGLAGIKQFRIFFRERRVTGLVSFFPVAGNVRGRLAASETKGAHGSSEAHCGRPNRRMPFGMWRHAGQLCVVD